MAKAVERAEADQNTGDARPAWQRVLTNARLPLYDVHWAPAIVLEKPAGNKGEAWRVGLTAKEIARTLAIAEATTKIHLAALVRALGVRNRTEAAYKAGNLAILTELSSAEPLPGNRGPVSSMPELTDVGQTSQAVG